MTNKRSFEPFMCLDQYCGVDHDSFNLNLQVGGYGGPEVAGAENSARRQNL